MSHAEHFLSRLIRLADDEVKLALALYHDSAWVRQILQSSAVPEAVERVALSLDDLQRGPFLIVTRDGHFVTCLARDMDPGSLPVIARDRLNSSAVKVERERERAALQGRIEGGDARLRVLMRRLFLDADSISREDFLEIAAWEPLLGPVFLNTYVAMAAELSQQTALLSQKRLARRASDVALREYWHLLHAAGHVALLGSMTNDRQDYDAIAESTPGVRSAFSYPLTGTGVTTFMLKGAWAAGRVGKPMLPAFKRALCEDVSLFELFDSLLVLLALGRRSSKYRAEIKKAVLAAPRKATTPEAIALRAALGREIELVCMLTASLLDASRNDLDEMLFRVGARHFEDHNQFAKDREIQDIATTLPLLSWTDGITDGTSLVRTFNLTAVASELPPERFYLPRAALDEFREPWTPDHTWRMLDPMTKAAKTRAPARREQGKVGRNELCACGSGRKSKRCCGA